MLGALGGGGGNQTNITNNFNLNNFMAQQKQATKVKTQSDTVSNLPDKQKQEDADAANKGFQESSQASSGTDAAKNTNGTSSTDNELQKEMTMLKAESQKLEFLTTAVKTTLDNISGLLNQLGRAG